MRGCSIAGDQDWEVAGDTHRGRRSLIGYVTLHEGSFLLADDHHQDDGDDGNDNKEAVGDVPAEVVDQQTNAGRCQGCAEQVSEEAGEASCGARNIRG